MPQRFSWVSQYPQHLEWERRGDWIVSESLCSIQLWNSQLKPPWTTSCLAAPCALFVITWNTGKTHSTLETYRIKKKYRCETMGWLLNPVYLWWLWHKLNRSRKLSDRWTLLCHRMAVYARHTYHLASFLSRIELGHCKIGLHLSSLCSMALCLAVARDQKYKNIIA